MEGLHGHEPLVAAGPHVDHGLVQLFVALPATKWQNGQRNRPAGGGGGRGGRGGAAEAAGGIREDRRGGGAAAFTRSRPSEAARCLMRVRSISCPSGSTSSSESYIPAAARRLASEQN